MTEDQEGESPTPIQDALAELRDYVEGLRFEGDTFALDKDLAKLQDYIYNVRAPIYREWAAVRARQAQARARARAKPFATSRADIAAVLTELKLTFKESKP